VTTESAKWQVERLIDAARGLASEIARLSERFDRERSLPAELVSKLSDEGLLSLWLAREFDGPEISAVDFARIIEELSRADGSAGWCAMIAAAYSRFSGFLAADVARTLFPNRRGDRRRNHQSDGTGGTRPGRIPRERPLGLRELQRA